MSSILSIDPTRSSTLRRSLERIIRGWFNEMKELVWKNVVEDDDYGLSNPPPLQPEGVFNAGGFKFASSDTKVKAFTKFLGDSYDVKVNSKTQEGVLTRYVVMMHNKGMARSYDDVNRGKLTGGTKEKQLMNLGGRQEFLKRAKVSESVLDRVKVLASRTFMDIDGATKKSADKMRRILIDGMASGANPKVVGRMLMKELDMTKNQAMMVARTEMIRAHAEGQLDAMERLGVTRLTAVVEFTATKLATGEFESRVCPDCQDLDGEEFSLLQPNKEKLDSPRGVIPVHPNCRCAWRPVRNNEVLKKTPKSKTPPKPNKPEKKELKSFKVTMFGKTVKPAKKAKMKTSSGGKAKMIPQKKGKLKKVTRNEFVRVDETLTVNEPVPTKNFFANVIDKIRTKLSVTV